MRRLLPRQTPIVAGQSALLVIDMQQAFCLPGRGIFETPAAKWTAERREVYFRALGPALANAGRLARGFRASGQEVLYTVIESLTADGRERSLDHKLSDLHVPKDSWGGKVMPEVAPQGDEMVLPKSSSGAFNSTVIDYVLRNLGIEHLVICGIYTDQCVESAVRDASDKGYYTTLVSDACVGQTLELHDNSCRAMAAYGRVRTTAELLDELKQIEAA